MSRLRTTSLGLLFTLPLLAALVPAACADTQDYQSNTSGGPPGTGGYDPGDGGLNSSSSGATTGTSGSGGQGGDPGPPMCDDALKRCAHLFTYPAGAESSVEVRGDWEPTTWMTGVPMIKNGAQWEATIDVPWAVDVQYKFVLDGANWVNDPNNPSTISDGFGGFNSLLSGVTCDVWTCVPPAGTFDWRDAVLYFVFVDRFLDGDPSNNGAKTPNVPADIDWKGGDWAGVKAKIDEGYFGELGVNVLWLSVPMDNTSQAGLGDDGNNYSAYHGYWPQNLDQSEEHFGSLVELKDVVDAAHAQGIKVILDYAMNHVHSSSPVYAQHQDWFWSLADCGVCGQGCSWDGAEGKKCWFRDYLPDFNFSNAAARDFSVDNALWWIDQTGIDGFRLDAVKHIEDQWILDLRSRVTAEIEPQTGEHFYMVGETFTGDKPTIKYYVNPVTMLDGQFDFPLRVELVNSLLNRTSSMSALDGFLAGNDNYYGAGVMSTFVGNHDVPRAIHFAASNGGDEWANAWYDGKDKGWNSLGLPAGDAPFERLMNAFTLLYTTKGVPLMYYGDEVGLPGAGDPDNRRMMQWSGYSNGQQKLFDHTKKLGQIRAAHVALRRGTRTTLSVNTDTYAYKLVGSGDTVYVALNRSDSSQQVGGLPASALTDQLTGASAQGPTVTVPARSAMILTP
jgi:glycosidase